MIGATGTEEQQRGKTDGSFHWSLQARCPRVAMTRLGTTSKSYLPKADLLATSFERGNAVGCESSGTFRVIEFGFETTPNFDPEQRP
jgi:hypothetical protein